MVDPVRQRTELPPAPGSDLAGAPPALKRQLTSDDGRQGARHAHPSETKSGASSGTAPEAAPTKTGQIPTGSTTKYLPALGLLAAALAVTADTWCRGRRSRTTPPT